MTEDDKPRSAVEIAMERLKQRDAEGGVVDQPRTGEQKTAISEARSVHAAKAAELQILQRSKMAAVFDPAERERLDAEYRSELRRLNEDLERKVARIREASGD
jgi:fructose-1,6-bisphosphatase/inositol monophosphatase family enzyme